MVRQVKFSLPHRAVDFGLRSSDEFYADDELEDLVVRPLPQGICRPWDDADEFDDADDD